MKEYKVISPSGDKIEKELNDYAKDGWEVKSACMMDMGSFSTKLKNVIILEREKK